MRSEARLESVIFQLTPTRTRCELVIFANGKTERIASGLLNPFLAHLKSAQDQISKGGYSIKLEVDHKSDSEWFTKGTVERFVRFVSTPEVLERVNTIEAEIIQIEEAIAIQANDSFGLSTDLPTRNIDQTEGTKPSFVVEADRAIVLYKPEPSAADSNESTTQEENSKVHLLRVLENRKNVLQKEQGMAFARAVAAGFDMDQMPHLVSFAIAFGAARLKEASLRFMELWKCKHETGQWFEVEAAEAMSSRSEFSLVNTSGIAFSGDTRMPKEFNEGEYKSAESNHRDGTELTSHQMDSEHNLERKFPPDCRVASSPHEYYQGQFPHHMFPQWPVQNAPGPPVYQPYPMQGVPYFQNYPGGAPYFPSYPPMEDPRFVKPKKKGHKRHSVGSNDSNNELKTSEMGSEDEEEGRSRGSHKKSNLSYRRRSGKVSTGDHITSKRYTKSESESASESESGEETEQNHSDAPERKHKHSSGSLKKKCGQTKSIDVSHTNVRDDMHNYHEADSGNWDAFQSSLMKAEEDSGRAVDRDMFSGEKPPMKRREGKSGSDPILFAAGDGDIEQRKLVEFDSMNGNNLGRPRGISSMDELQTLNGGRRFKEGPLNAQFKGIDDGRGLYRKAGNDEFIINGQQKQFSSRRSSDPLAENDLEHPVLIDRYRAQNAPDESFMLPCRSGSPEEQHSDNRLALPMDSEFPSFLRKSEDSSNKMKNQPIYEPHDFHLLPERETGEPAYYDPAKDYDVQFEFKETDKRNIRNQGKPVNNEEVEKVGKEDKSRVVTEKSEKRKVEPTRKGKPSKLSPLAEAQSRAEKLRAYKNDLQKLKKEKEEEAIKRLEALKLERQKRIASRSAPSTTQTSSKQPIKLSPNTNKSSKFSDSAIGSSSPMQKPSLRMTSVGLNSKDFNRLSKTGKANPSARVAQNGLSHSMTSLPELKKGNSRNIPEAKAVPIKSKRFSDPLGSSKARASSQKSVAADNMPKKNLSDESQRKKISAILHLDEAKSASLPELKILSSSDKIQKMSSVNEDAANGMACRTSTSESNQVKKSKGKASTAESSEESPVIDKTIVMLENEAVQAPKALPPKGLIDAKGSSCEGFMSASDYETSGALPISIKLGGFGKPSDGKMKESQTYIKQDIVDHTEGDFQTSLKENLQSPYTGETPKDGQIASNAEYTGTEACANSVQGISALISMFEEPNSGDQIHSVNEKPRNKDLKGFKKLFKFGRKSHGPTSSEHSLEMDCSPADDGLVGAASSEVFTLKNLISSDDTHSGSTTPKAVSRHFSLLSPFKVKSNEKKLTE